MELEKIIQDLNQLNFTAIDFETANEQRNSICSVGLVVVRQGKITNKQNHLVKPKELRFTDINKRIHGISEEDVFNAPEFNSVWEQIQHLIDKQIVLAHNADFDVDVLKQTLNTYKLPHPTSKYICTQKLAQETFSELKYYRLTDVAIHLGLNLTHHDSVSDATVSAEIGLKAIPLYDKKYYNYSHEELTYYINKKNSAKKKDNYTSGFSQKTIDSNLLKPNLDIANTNNPFYNKKVVFTGDLQKIGRQEAATKIQNFGADINTSISKKTEIVIVGNAAGPSKMKKIEELNSQGCNIRLIYEEEFLSLIK